MSTSAGLPVDDDLPVAHDDEVGRVARRLRRGRAAPRRRSCRGRAAGRRGRAGRTGARCRGTSSARRAAAPSVCCASAIATQTRCRWPPESSSTGTSTRSVRSVSARAVATASRSASDHWRNSPWCGYRPRATSSPTVMPSGACDDLGQQPDRARRLLRGHAGQVAAVEQHAARPGREEARERPQEGRLAAGVRPDDHGERAVADARVDRLGDRAALVGEVGAPGLEAGRAPSARGGRVDVGHGALRLSPTSRTTRYAPPMTRVTSPTGTGFAATCWATTSATSSSRAPSARRPRAAPRPTGSGGGRAAARRARRRRSARCSPSRPRSGRPRRPRARGATARRAGRATRAASSPSSSCRSGRASSAVAAPSTTSSTAAGTQLRPADEGERAGAPERGGHGDLGLGAQQQPGVDRVQHGRDADADDDQPEPLRLPRGTRAGRRRAP